MLKNGNIVLYKKQAALIQECAEKYTIVYAGGTQKVREKDICLLHEGPLSSLRQLEQFPQEQAFCAQKDELNRTLDETWELLQEEKQDFTLSSLAEFALGVFSPEKTWLMYTALLRHPRFLPLPLNAPEQPHFALRTAEESEKLLARQNEKNREKEKRSAFIERLRKKCLILPQDGVFMTEVEALALGKTDKSRIMQEAQMRVSAERAHKLLLDCGIWTIYRNPHPSRWGLSVQSASERLSRPQQDERLSLEHTAYAIDDSRSADPDDALAFDGTYVWVHIADPAETVLPDSAIDKAARARGATLYIPEGAARMLAEESLADYALGLSEAENKTAYSRALSFRIKLNKDGAIEETAVLKTKVKVRRLTFEQADEQSSCEELAVLFKIAEKNIERRKAAGAVFIKMPEIDISLDNANATPLVRIRSSVHCRSTDLVREFMLLAGEAAARFAFKNKIPFPYVCQEKSDIPRDLPVGLAGQYRLRRCMKSRSVSITPAVHSGLGLSMYSQVTSPLRRYSDLIAHQQLHAFLDDRSLLNKDAMLERISAGDAAAMAAVKAERKSNMHWTLVYLLQNPNWQGEAVIVDITENRATLLIPSLAQQSLIPLPAGKGLNDTVIVKAANINIPELTVNYIAI